MANPNGRKGAQFETDVMRWLRSAGALCERLVKAGKNDEGDLVAIVGGKQYILELKNRKTISLPEFWREAEIEAENYAKARGLASSGLLACLTLSDPFAPFVQAPRRLVRPSLIRWAFPSFT